MINPHTEDVGIAFCPHLLSYTSPPPGGHDLRGADGRRGEYLWLCLRPRGYVNPLVLPRIKRTRQMKESSIRVIRVICGSICVVTPVRLRRVRAHGLQAGTSGGSPTIEWAVTFGSSTDKKLVISFLGEPLPDNVAEDGWHLRDSACPGAVGVKPRWHF